MLDAVAISSRAESIFTNGVCCSEAIVYAISEEIDPQHVSTYMKMSSGFCGGMGQGSVCGVVNGCKLYVRTCGWS